MEARGTGRLLAEIGTYLDVIEFFRLEGCEPRWRSEGRVSRAAVRRGAERRRRGSAKPRKSG